ncbi:MAG TPA: GyrI-like domain-containing protein [Anaerolineales bacterium]|jgi:hypothetical protein|nr:GyrI-like domain-containing protein [Anaerolineales bacterium]
MKLDYKKDLKQLYFPRVGVYEVVEVPSMKFLMIDGHGDPNDNPVYQEAVSALYTLAYGLRFALKSQGVEAVVPPLEGLWWAEDINAFTLERKDRWDWTMMIMQPEMVTPELFAEVRRKAVQKKGVPALERVRLETFAQGLCVQTMYLGAYKDEGPTIAAMHAFLREYGYDFNGKHHEIYLGDPRKSTPDKLKTVIRQPVKPV